MEKDLAHKRAGRWGPAGGVILALLALGPDPAHAYYICAQPDGSRLMKDYPGPGCVKQEEPAPPPGLPPVEAAQESMVKTEPPGPEEIPGEDLDLNGHNREWWQVRLQDLKQERNRLLAHISDAEKRLHSIPPNLPVTKRQALGLPIRNELESLNHFLQIVNQQIREKLPEEARKAGAPPGWVRE